MTFQTLTEWNKAPIPFEEIKELIKDQYPPFTKSYEEYVSTVDIGSPEFLRET